MMGVELGSANDIDRLLVFQGRLHSIFTSIGNDVFFAVIF